MPTVKVTKIGKARSGKPIAYFDNKHGQTDGYLVGDKCQVPAEGMTIDAETKSWDYRGVTYWGLNDWKQVKSPASAVGAAARSNGASHQGWDIQSGDLSRFVSNLVGSAIAAGMIKEPIDIHRWTKSAYGAAQSLLAGFPEGRPESPDPSTHAGDPDPEAWRDGFTDDKIPF